MNTRQADSTLQPDLFSQSTKEVLEGEQWIFDQPIGSEVYELRLNLATPAVCHSGQGKCACYRASYT